MKRRSFFGGLAALIVTPVLAKIVPAQAKRVADGWAAGASSLKRGDVFTISGVYSVNPLSYRVTDRLQQFVATKDVAAGDTTVMISPVIITSGVLQTVECNGRWRPRRDQTVKNNFAPRGPLTFPGTDEVPLSVVTPQQKWTTSNTRNFQQLVFRA